MFADGNYGLEILKNYFSAGGFIAAGFLADNLTNKVINYNGSVIDSFDDLAYLWMEDGELAEYVESVEFYTDSK